MLITLLSLLAVPIMFTTLHFEQSKLLYMQADCIAERNRLQTPNRRRS